MNIKNGNLVNLDEWKNAKRDNSFSDYLKVLNFNDLVTESNALINEIKNDQTASDLIGKTKLMMNEFANRLEKESKHLADSVIEMKKNIENFTHRDQ